MVVTMVARHHMNHGRRRLRHFSIWLSSWVRLKPEHRKTWALNSYQCATSCCTTDHTVGNYDVLAAGHCAGGCTQYVPQRVRQRYFITRSRDQADTAHAVERTGNEREIPGLPLNCCDAHTHHSKQIDRTMSWRLNCKKPQRQVVTSKSQACSNLPGRPSLTLTVQESSETREWCLPFLDSTSHRG